MRPSGHEDESGEVVRLHVTFQPPPRRGSTGIMTEDECSQCLQGFTLICVFVLSELGDTKTTTGRV